MKLRRLHVDSPVYNFRNYLALILVGLFGVPALLLGGWGSDTASAAAGINKNLNFQGRLLNSSGAVVADGNYNLRFKVYQDGTGCVSSGSSPCSGTLMWTELWQNSVATGSSSGVTVRNGYFSVALGTFCAFTGGSCQGNTNTGVDWNQDTLWVSVDVGGTAVSNTPTYDGEMLPFRRLASTVYSLQADNANKLGGLSSAQFIQNTTTVQTGANSYIRSAATGSVVSVLEGANGQTADLLDLNTFNGTTSTTVAKFTAAGNLQVASSIDTVTGTALAVGGGNATSVTVGRNTSTTSTTVQSGSGGYSITSTGNGSVTANGSITITAGGGSTWSTSAGNLIVQAGGTDELRLTTGGAGIVALGDQNATTIRVGRGSNIARTIEIGTAGTSQTQTISIGSVGGASTVNLKAGSVGVVINDSVNSPTNINTGTSTGTVSIGNASSPILVQGNGAATSTVLVGLRVAADTNERFQIRADGGLLWGPGNGATDISVTRSGTNTLTVSSNFTAATLTAGAGTIIGAAKLAVQPTNTSTIATVIRGSNGQTADLLQLQEGVSGSNYVNASFSALGNQLTLGRIAATGTNTQGKLVFADGTADNFSTTVQSTTLTTGSQILTLPDTAGAGGTFCLQGSTACGFAPSATNGYVQLAPGIVQTDGTNNNTVYINKTSATGNLLQFQRSAADVFVVSNAGNLQVASSIDTVTGTALAVGGTNATQISLAQDTAISTGKTLTVAGNTTYNMDQDKTITVNSALSAGSRSASVLTVTQANDATNNATAPLVTFTNNDSATGVAVLELNQLNASTTNLQLNANLGAGTALRVSGTGSNNPGASVSYASGTAPFSGAYLKVDPARHLTSGTGTYTESGNFLQLARNNFNDTSAATYAITGDLATFSSACTQNSGTCTDSSSILNLNQQYTGASGSVLKVQGAGTGALLQVRDTTSTAVDVLTIADGGAATFQSQTNSASAFNILNAAGMQAFRVDSTADSGNLVTNGSFEVNTTGWAVKAGGSLTRTTSSSFHGVAALSTTTTAAGDGVKYNLTLSTSTQYTINFMAQAVGSGFSTMNYGYAVDGSTETDCKTAQNPVTTGFKIFTCTFTTTATAPSGTPYIYIKQTDGTARTFYIDAFQIRVGSSAGVYRETAVQVPSAITSAFGIQPTIDSSLAFNVESADGSTLLAVDSVNKRIGIGTQAPSSYLHVARTTSNDATVMARINTTSTQSGDLLQFFDDTATAVLSKFGADADLIVKPQADMAVTFQVQKNNGDAVLTVDTSGSNVVLGKAGPSGVTGNLQFANSAGANLVTIQAQGSSAAYTLQLPSSLATSNQCLQAGTVAGSVVPLTFGACGSGSTLQGSYDADADGSDAIIALTTADDSIILRNPSSGGSDSTYILTLDQLSTGARGGLSIQSAGTGNLLLVTDTTATARDVLTVADGGATTFRNQANSTSALKVTNANGVENLINVDTTNSVVSFNYTTPGTYFGNGYVNVARSGYGFTHTNAGAVTQSTWVGNEDGLDLGSIGTETTSAFGIYTNNAKVTFAVLSGGNVNIGRNSADYIGTNSAQLQVRSSTASEVLFKVTDATSTDVDVLTVADEGAVTLKTRTNTAGAFSVQNASSTDILTVDSTPDSTNLITNSNFESNTTGWLAKGTASGFNTSTTQKLFGARSLIFTSNATGDGVKYNTTLTASTLYTLTGYVRGATSNTTSMSVGYAFDGSTESTYTCAISSVTTGWTRFTCQFTPASVSGTPYLYVKTTSSTVRTFYLDAVTLSATSGVSEFLGDGSIRANAQFKGQFTIQNGEDSTRAFSINTANSTDLFVVDTLNQRIGLKTSTPNAVLDIANSTDTLLKVTDTTGTDTDALLIDATGTASFTNNVDSATGFRIQNASSVAMFTVDTSAARLYVGPTAGDTVGTILVLGNKTNAGDPTGVDGAMYYNSNYKRMRCYYDGQWRFCNDPVGLTWGTNLAEDFITSSTTTGEFGSGWYGAVSGTGANVAQAVSIANRAGIVNLTTGTTTTGDAQLVMDTQSAFNIQVTGGEEIEFAINIPTLADVTNDYDVRIGLCLTASDCTAGVYFEYDRGTSTAWRIATANSSTRTKTTTSTTVATGWTRFKILVNSAGNSIDYYINGTNVGTITTNIPTTGTEGSFGIIKSAGTAARSIDVDYFQYRRTLTTPR